MSSINRLLKEDNNDVLYIVGFITTFRGFVATLGPDDALPSINTSGVCKPNDSEHQVLLVIVHWGLALGGFSLLALSNFGDVGPIASIHLRKNSKLGNTS